MSKAFTREDGGTAEEEPIARMSRAPGWRNYITPEGATRLREEAAHLAAERPRLAARKDDPDEAQRLRRLDARLRDLAESIETMEEVPPPETAAEVQFGATVTVRDAEGQLFEYRIVGADEVDLARGWVSWSTPLARGLVRKRVGNKVALTTPTGENELEIVGISYPDCE